MRLDKTLVRNVMREVTGTDPDGDRFIGRIFMGPNNQFMHDNDSQTGMMLDRVLAHACRSWYRRFRAPLVHCALLTRATMHRSLQAVIRRSPGVRHRKDTDRMDTTLAPDDWDKLLDLRQARGLVVAATVPRPRLRALRRR